MGTYPSILVHLFIAVALYFIALYGIRFVIRRWGKVAQHWIRLSLPALLVLIVCFFREAFDGQTHGPVKAFFDNLGWLAGAAASVYLAHRITKDSPLDSL